MQEFQIKKFEQEERHREELHSAQIQVRYVTLRIKIKD